MNGILWAVNNEAEGAAQITADYVTIGQAPLGATTAIDVWHWLSVPVDQTYGTYAGQFYYRVTKVSS